MTISEMWYASALIEDMVVRNVVVEKIYHQLKVASLVFVVSILHFII